MNLVLERNANAINDPTEPLAKSTGIYVTPPIDESFWLMRVRVSDKQAVVLFPKFGVFGIGFQVETDWNTNLSANAPALEIYQHIKRNKGDESIPDGRCVEAILMLQAAVLEMKQASAVQNLKATNDVERRLQICASYLRSTGAWRLAEAMNL